MGTKKCVAYLKCKEAGVRVMRLCVAGCACQVRNILLLHGAVTLFLHVAQVLTGFEKRTNRVAFTDNNATLLSAGEDGCVRRWDVEVCCFVGNTVGLPWLGFGIVMQGGVFLRCRGLCIESSL